MLARNLVLKWETKLKREGLAPIDQVIGHRVVVRTEIITPVPAYLREPERLRRALAAWLDGDGSHFKAEALELLAKTSNQKGRNWPAARARVLLGICEALAEGMTVNETIRRRGDRDIAYTYLRALERHLLAQESAMGDDDDERIQGD